MSIQALYQQAIRFATAKHLEQNQTIPGTNLPYLVHLSNVAMEILLAAPSSPGFNLGFAIQLALLHDVLEDTSATVEVLATQFGTDIARGVLALTKDPALPKAEKMLDSLVRIKASPLEVWSVKLADRITNLQAPPSHWDTAKRKAYHQEAMTILDYLRGGNAYLENRLKEQINAYERYL